MLGFKHRAKHAVTTNGKERTVHPSTRRFSRGRITGLAVIAVLTLGLGYLHFAGSSTAVSVPAGAHAGQLTMHPCTYSHREGCDAPPTAERWSCRRTEPTRSRG